MAANFNTSFINIHVARQHIPNKMVQTETKDGPWYATELRKLKRTKDNIHKIAKRTRKATDWVKFRQARNQHTNSLRETVEAHKPKMAKKLKNTKKHDPTSLQ